MTVPVVNHRHGQMDAALERRGRRRDVRVQKRRQYLYQGERSHAGREGGVTEAGEAVQETLLHADGPARIRSP